MTDKSIGQIAYEAAARLTKCNQPWSESNQLKWEDAAKAVHDIAIQSPEAAKYWSDKHCEAVDRCKKHGSSKCHNEYHEFVSRAEVKQAIRE